MRLDTEAPARVTAGLVMISPAPGRAALWSASWGRDDDTTGAGEVADYDPAVVVGEVIDYARRVAREIGRRVRIDWSASVLHWTADGEEVDEATPAAADRVRSVLAGHRITLPTSVGAWD